MFGVRDESRVDIEPAEVTIGKVGCDSSAARATFDFDGESAAVFVPGEEVPAPASVACDDRNEPTSGDSMPRPEDVRTVPLEPDFKDAVGMFEGEECTSNTEGGDFVSSADKRGRGEFFR